MDGQSVKTTERGGSRGFDGHKKVKGRKRHILVDTLGMMIARRVEPANTSDRRAGERLLAGLSSSFPKIQTGNRRCRSSSRCACSPLNALLCYGSSRHDFHRELGAGEGAALCLSSPELCAADCCVLPGSVLVGAAPQASSRSIDRLRRACLQENAAALLAPLRCPADGFRRPSAFRINKSAALVVLRARPSELRGEMICEL